MPDNTRMLETNGTFRNEEKKENEIFIGRQPILNRLKKTFGYELLLRRSTIQCANVTDNLKATANVMVNALNIDIEELFKIENNAIIEYENMNRDNNK